MNEAQKVSLAVAVKCTSILSILGSIFIAQEIIRHPKKRKTVYHRLILALSLSDISVSSACFVGSWGIPKNTAGIFMPLGNEITCKMQGFLIQLGMTTPFYNASLSLYYLLIINYGYKEKDVLKIEPLFHLVPLLWGFGTAILGLAWDQYHNSNLWCWISSTPQTKVLRWALFYGPLWVILFFVTVLMFVVYRYVHLQERAVAKYDFESSVANVDQGDQTKSMRGGEVTFQDETDTGEGTTSKDITNVEIIGNNDNNAATDTEMPSNNSNNDNNNNNSNNKRSVRTLTSALSRKKTKRLREKYKYSRTVAIQSFFWCFAFWMAYIFPSLVRLIQTINGKTYYPLLILFAIFFPMQGFLNFLVYLRPRFKRYLEKKAQRQRDDDSSGGGGRAVLKMSSIIRGLKGSTYLSSGRNFASSSVAGRSSTDQQ